MMACELVARNAHFKLTEHMQLCCERLLTRKLASVVLKKRMQVRFQTILNWAAEQICRLKPTL